MLPLSTTPRLLFRNALIDLLVNPAFGDRCLGTYTLQGGGVVDAVDWYTPELDVVSVEGLELVIADTVENHTCIDYTGSGFRGEWTAYLQDYNPGDTKLDTAIARIVYDYPYGVEVSNTAQDYEDQQLILSCVIKFEYYFSFVP